VTRKAKGRDKAPGRLIISAASGVATLAILAAIVVGVVFWSYSGPGPTARAGEATRVMLRPGSGLSEIGSTLDQAGVIGSGPLFVAVAQLTGAGRVLKAGEYEFPSRTSMASVLSKIRRGEVVRHYVTIPEGLTSEMAVAILMDSPVLSGVAPVPPEGTILPETYEVTRGEDRAAVLNRMTADHDRLLAQLWSQRAQGLPITTPDEAVILASIVEKETGVASERPMVARVFINRLEQGMRLQSDPTIIYGITRGRPLGRGILQSELVAPTPYNTYVIDRLPPTPIANPGRAALAAVLSPPPGDWLYFVADGTGGHAFAKTLEEHTANVARWREIEAKRAATQAAGKAN